MLDKKSQDPARITIITPVFNEEKSLQEYRKRVEEDLFTAPDIDFQIIFVDDGSTDSSWQLIQEFCRESPRFHALKLSRNFGVHIALSAGLHKATGDAIATLPCDLQDPPLVILEFIKKWKNGAQVVWGKRLKREDVFWKKNASRIFSFLLQRFALPKESKFTSGSFFLIDRAVLNCFKLFKEHSRVTFALVAWTGFDQDVVYYERKERRSGSSKWTFPLMIKALYDAFLSFSNIPAKIATFIGILVWIFNLFFSIYLVIIYLHSDVLPGWTGIMLFISALFGTQFLILGIIIEYLRRIHIESTNRPLYFVSQQVGNFKD